MYQKTFGKSEKNLGTFANAKQKTSSISTTYLIGFLISQETPVGVLLDFTHAKTVLFVALRRKTDGYSRPKRYNMKKNSVSIVKESR